MASRTIDKPGHYFYLITAVAGIALLLRSQPVLALTFVPLRFFLILMGSVTLVATLLSIHKFRSAFACPPRTGIFLAICWNLLSWGFTATSVFLFSNYYLSEGEKHRKEFVILERTDQPGNKGEHEKIRPAFTISYRGMEKELVFANRFYKWKDDYKTVILTLQEGRWGFEVIKGKAVTK